jgi:MFS transporter, ACS family, hexuronate transporter
MVLTGRLLDLSKSHGNVTASYTLLFAVCSCAYLFAFAIRHLCAPKFESFSL